jgi:hypothetical protein
MSGRLLTADTVGAMTDRGIRGRMTRRPADAAPAGWSPVERSMWSAYRSGEWCRAGSAVASRVAVRRWVSCFSPVPVGY